ncbi:NAD-dependent protein deacylase [Bacillus sp. 165]|uniref:NAD-dependent protein deacylase n=1 Tax=Bacillus sp. 165 TaxID=1529117 RepID=UPI001ADA7E11|nr:NAD-dependent protein deacylase [Bacillus sp. 165]MBO9129167.1 NAD-dependent protein deacylase [Bacillus sp. 165]
MKKWEQSVSEWLQQYSRFTFMTGAGMSTTSGIPDYRSKNGMYEKYENVEYLLSQTYYNRKPKEFWKTFKELFSLAGLCNIQPNEGHYFISYLAAKGKETAVITQNIDGLHQKAGNPNVFDMHGSYDEAFCLKCKKEYDLPYILKEDVPRCEECALILKPNVVLYGDAIRHTNQIIPVLEATDVVMVMGSSLSVRPANEFPLFAKQHGAKLMLINLEPTPMDPYFDIVLHEDIVTVTSNMEKMLQEM